MRRVVLAVAVAAFCCLALSAEGSFGASVSLGGRSDSLTQAALGVHWLPWRLACLSPFVQGEAYISLSRTALAFGGLRAELGVELFHTLRHPFKLVSANPALWAPAASCGVDWDTGAAIGHGELSVFRFLEKDAVYEYVVPFVDFTRERIERFGFLIFRFSGLV